jgi:hypothetical protein
MRKAGPDMKLKLRDITDSPGENQYCGPSVISAVTELTAGEAARLIRELTGKRKVTGTHPVEIRAALNACNIQMVQLQFMGVVERYDGPDLKPVRPNITNRPRSSITLSRWLKNTVKIRNAERVFLVVGANHWQLVSGRRYICGLTPDRRIVSVKHAPRRRGRITAVFELLSNNVQIPETIKQYRKDRSTRY